MRWVCQDAATVYRPEERLTFAQALHLYTVGAAYACGEEHRLGKIAPGFEADFTILDVDVSEEPRLLATATVEQVWVAGVPRFDRARGIGGGVLPPGVQLGGPCLLREIGLYILLLILQYRDLSPEQVHCREKWTQAAGVSTFRNVRVSHASPFCMRGWDARSRLRL